MIVLVCIFRVDEINDEIYKKGCIVKEKTELTGMSVSALVFLYEMCVRVCERVCVCMFPHFFDSQSQVRVATMYDP